ncbi:UNVERIFIED_CONTAM: protein CELLULOSE SYNTHASE INTERACTIVE 1 [Sesamum radiatum]|uniref:Protein CELLULOSE SYNTHASE INTERACTIVE 1 n=1 Tax=Sesamum radiatum TaxID=300843 RepID=A0AAW2V5P2_SESRA
MTEDASVCSKVLAAEATKLLLKLLGPGNEASLRAEAAGALKSLSAQCKEARREIANANGIPVLINATIAPSKEFMQVQTSVTFLVQERTIEALASLYGNAVLACKLVNSDAKRLLVGLITMATNEVQEELIRSFLFSATMKRQGLQKLKKTLQQSSETSVIIVDIRACVESDAVPLLWLLKNGSPNGKEIATKTLNHLIHKSDTATISQLTALLTGDLPESKVYVLDALKSLLSVAPLNDIMCEGSAANDAIETMIKILHSTKEETQAKSALALAGIFDLRKDLRETNIAVKTLLSVVKLLNVKSEDILVGASHCVAAIFLSIKENRDVAAVARDASALLVLANSSTKLQSKQVLREGTNIGKINASAAIARLLHSRQIDSALTDSIDRTGTVLALVSFLEAADSRSIARSEALDALAFLSRPVGDIGDIKPACAVLADYPTGIIPIVSCIADATPLLQDKAVEILCRLCQAQPLVLGSTIASATGCVSSIARRLISSKNARVKIGGAALLVCSAKVNHQGVVEDLNGSNLCASLIHSLVGLLTSAEISEVRDQGRKDIISVSRVTDETNNNDSERCTSVIYGVNIAVWLLSKLASCDDKSKLEIMEAGGIEVLAEKISQCFLQYTQSDYREDGSIWICALLLAVLFQDRDIIRAHATMNTIPVLANLLRSEEVANRYFAAQAVASLVCNGSRGTLLSVANSGAAAGLIALLGCADADICDLLELSEEFGLVHYPDQVALEKLFRVDDIRASSTSRKAIPALVDLLKPIPGRPGAPFLALGLLIQLAKDCSPNQTVMVESGALEGLTRYLSLGPQDAYEEAATDLLGILFSTAEIRTHESAFGAVSQLVAVLRLGGRAARYSAAKALENLFSADHVRNAESSRQAVQPLVEILNTGNTRIRSTLAAARCVEPLVSLLVTEYSPAHHSVVRALDELLDDEQLAELVATHGAVIPLLGLLHGENYLLHEAICRALVKLGKDRPACKMEMVKAGVVESMLNILHEAPIFLCDCICSNTPIQPFQKNIPRADYTLTPQQALEPLLPLLDSPASAVQQLAAELVSHLLLEEHLQRDPLIQQFSSEFYLEVPVAVLVRLLRSGSESTVIGALNALLVLESDDPATAEAMAESGAIEALLDILRNHQCEESAARLLEVLLNNVKIRESKVTKSAILPLSQYLLDPQTQGQQARLLATLALGDLFQNEVLARTADAVSACRALVNLLEDQPTEEMKVVAICTLQNLVMYSKKKVAEAGGVQVLLDLIGSSVPETSVQAAMFVKLLFSNNTIQEYASSETVRAITAAIEKHLWASGTVNEEYLKALNALFGNFPRLRGTEPATLSIPHLVTSLKTGSEATQEAVLDSLVLLRQAWSACPAEVSRAQSIAAADAIPLLQYLIQSGPPRFQEKAEFLLQCLPGTLMVVSTGPNPEWGESFSWSFESPPKGQKLHISCKNKSKMGKSSFGKVTIQIDRVVMLGAVAGSTHYCLKAKVDLQGIWK